MADKMYQVICPKCGAGGADIVSHRPTCHVCIEETEIYMMPADDLAIMKQMLEALRFIYIDASERNETHDDNGVQYADYAFAQTAIRNCLRRMPNG